MEFLWVSFDATRCRTSSSFGRVITTLVLMVVTRCARLAALAIVS